MFHCTGCVIRCRLAWDLSTYISHPQQLSNSVSPVCRQLDLIRPPTLVLSSMSCLTMCKTRCASCLLPTEMDAELPHPRCSHLGIGNSCLAAGLQFTGLGSPQSRPIAACFVRSSGRVSPPHHISSDILGARVLQHPWTNNETKNLV